MKASTMRRIDRFIGIPLCYLVGIANLVRPERRLTEVRTILVMKCFGMGSIILMSSALCSLRRRYPVARIDFVTFEPNKELVERYSMVDTVHIVRTTSLRSFMADTIRLLIRIRKAKYDVIFDLEFFSKFSSLISGISGAPYRSGFALPARWRSMILTHQVEIDKRRHVRDSFCEQIFSLCGPMDVPDLLPPVVRDDDRVSMNAKLPLNGKAVVAINVNASDTFLERRWLPGRFANLVGQLSREHDWVFYFIGSKHEREYIEQVIEATGCRQRCYNIAGVLTIPELAAFFDRCEMLITGDSGPAHLAAAMNTRVIGLYGPESPAFYGPLSPSAKIIYKAVPCSPCMNIYSAKAYRCPNSALCMREIQIGEVRNAVEQAMINA